MDYQPEHRPVRKACSFCGKAREQVRRLIAGPRETAICETCVRRCNEILAAEGVQPAP